MNRATKKVREHYTGTTVQQWDRYTEEEHSTWRELRDRQAQILQGRACLAWHKGFRDLELPDTIPKFEAINQILEQASGWQVIAVDGLIHEREFFTHLAARRFPVSWWIRKREQMDYLPEPDLFHDLFGHVPMLMDRTFGDFVQGYGAGGLKALAIEDPALRRIAIRMLTRLYWYTVEFGLIREDRELKIYGGGILSSASESIYALEAPDPHRLDFDLKKAMQTAYPVETHQHTYFVIKDYSQIIRETEVDFMPIYRSLAAPGDP